MGRRALRPPTAAPTIPCKTAVLRRSAARRASPTNNVSRVRLLRLRLFAFACARPLRCDRSEHEANTERLKIMSTQMRHREGGWPKDVDCTEPLDVNRYRKKAEKDDDYKSAVKTLGPIIGRCMKQNNTVNIYEVRSPTFCAHFVSSTLSLQPPPLPPRFQSRSFDSPSYTVAARLPPAPLICRSTLRAMPATTPANRPPPRGSLSSATRTRRSARLQALTGTRRAPLRLPCRILSSNFRTLGS